MSVASRAHDLNVQLLILFWCRNRLLKKKEDIPTEQKTAFGRDFPFPRLHLRHESLTTSGGFQSYLLYTLEIRRQYPHRNRNFPHMK